MPHTLMAHMIPWFPDRPSSLEAAKGILEGGASYLEVQFPFSDPTADGPVIEAACTSALARGFTVDGGFGFVKEVYDWLDGFPQGSPHVNRVQGPPALFIMSYASLVVARGIERFVTDAVKSGAKGLIIPDLPPDSDEGLYATCRRAGLHAVPVVVPFTTPERLDLILATQPQYLYVALRAGITGAATALSPDVLALLDRLQGQGIKVLGGFGITSPTQVQELAPHVHAGVVGSALVRTIQSLPGSEGLRESLRRTVAELIA